jgi:hypothetical protein
MSQLQHRGGMYGKIVLKHHPIEGLVYALGAVERLPGVQTVVPGVITSVRGRPIAREHGGIVIKVQYIAPDGHIRLIARLGNTTQEIRVVSNDLEQTFADLRGLFP